MYGCAQYEIYFRSNNKSAFSHIKFKKKNQQTGQALYIKYRHQRAMD